MNDLAIYQRQRESFIDVYNALKQLQAQLQFSYNELPDNLMDGDAQLGEIGEEFQRSLSDIREKQLATLNWLSFRINQYKKRIELKEKIIALEYKEPEVRKLERGIDAVYRVVD